MLVIESSIIIAHLRTKFMMSGCGRKIVAPRYVLLLTYRKIMKKFLIFLSFLISLFLETSQYDKRGPSYIYLYISAKIEGSSRPVSMTR